ncbi:sensor histidine kinase [Paenibacillus alkalitolerans]|uniref:sensor histidine kinase n=1 Tax=Paenibacillus alkalitolerans TaxID=2799335 RepID=UPI002D7E6D60|nr:sensor histidine kinase [Paenibacillus alkalitolerans]
MWALFALMLERLGVIVTVAFVVTRFGFARKLLERRRLTAGERLRVIGFFGLFGIIGTYMGYVVEAGALSSAVWERPLAEGEAIANFRVIGIAAAGLLGGVGSGLGAGLVAGMHRFMLGGFTALACGLAAVVAGFLSGLVHRKQEGRLVSVAGAFGVGIANETIQMGIILLTARPFDRAFELVVQIGMPMVLANGVGCALFVLIIRNVISEEEKSGAAQAQKALRIAGVTVEHLSKGLTVESAHATCAILIREANAKAVAMTDREHILSHVGIASDHHRPMAEIRTDATKQVLNTGELQVVSRIGCSTPGCPLQAAIISPLKRKGETVGTLKFYFSSVKEISHMDLELIKGLTTLFGQQLEIAELQHYRHLAREAEIKALQTQIQPHFLFNALNTVVSMIRTKPDKARLLLISLSRYFRQNLAGTLHEESTLREEMQHVKAYLSIEEARFNDTLKVNYHIDEKCLHASIPSLTLQPIVENGMKHGLRSLNSGGELSISVESRGDEGVFVCVKDNGIGIQPERHRSLLSGGRHSPSEDGTGIGLYNVNRRLIMTLGPKAGLRIESEPGRGTAVSFVIPWKGAAISSDV